MRPAISIGMDVVLISPDAGSHSLLLIKRRNEPFQNHWALPGGFLEIDEDLETGAKRELIEETGISNVTLQQIGAFGNPERDPRSRVISIAYCGFLPQERRKEAKAADDAADAQWFDLHNLPPLAFDHAQIIETARKILNI